MAAASLARAAAPGTKDAASIILSEAEEDLEYTYTHTLHPTHIHVYTYTRHLVFMQTACTHKTTESRGG